MNKNIIKLLALGIILLSIIYVNQNQAGISSMLGNNYYKKNDVAQAQKYFEKSFALGNTNIKDRELYVNSIINNPFTVEKQEKLEKFIELNIEDTAQNKAEYFINDIKREINKIYDRNYIKHAPYNQQIIRWSKKPINYNYVITNSINGKIPSYFEEEIDKAFLEWERTTEHEILFSKETQNPDIIIEFMAHNPGDDDENQKYVVAYTVPEVIGTNLKNMYIKFYTTDTSGEVFSPNQVYNTALHEIAHALGFMGHSDDPNHVMYMSKDLIGVIKDKRENLTLADVNTIKLLYKIKPDITDPNKTESDYIQYVVLGKDDEINNAKIKAAIDYIKKAPYLPNGYIDLAEAYVATKDYSKAIDVLKKAYLLADTDDVKNMVDYNLAVAYFYNEDYSSALEHLEKSISISNSEEQRYLLAEIYVKQKNNDKAKEEYKNLIKEYPNNINYAISLANIYVTEKEYKKARKVIKNYVKHNPQEKNNSRLDPYGVLRIFL